MRIQFVIHADFEQPAAIQEWAEHKQFEIEFSYPFKGEDLFPLEAFDWLVVMGGPQSPLELEQYPYLEDEMDLIKKAIEADKVVLGFCLGAQLIGAALGGITEKSPHKEVGVFPIQFTEEGKKDPLLHNLANKLPVAHWHNDMPGLTKDAKILAFSEGCPRQIIRFGSKVYGFQCHPEMTFDSMTKMMVHCSEDLVPSKYVQSKEQILKWNYTEMNKFLFNFLDQLQLFEK